MLTKEQTQIQEIAIEQIKHLADWNKQESKRDMKNVEQIRLNCETIAKLTQVC